MKDFFFDPEIFDEADRIYAEVGEVRRKATVEKIPLPPACAVAPPVRCFEEHRIAPLSVAPDDGWEIW